MLIFSQKLYKERTYSMRGLRSIVNHFRYIKDNNLLVIAFFTLGLLSFGVLGLTKQDNAMALTRDNSANAIMTGGAADAAEFRTKFNQNAQGDLPAIYGHYRIPRDMQVVQGQSFRDGTVRVNGRVVATNAQSIGRQPISGSHPISIAGKTYYETPNSAAFMSDGLPTMVALDAAGNFKYAVINGCGNPIYATPTPTPPTPPPVQETPKYSCTNMTINHISNTRKSFTATAAASGGATITGYTFTFGDGSTQESTNATVEHDFAPGSYTTRVTVKFKVGDETKTDSGSNCVKSFKVAAPAEVACTSLTAIKRSNAETTYDFTIQKTNTNATYDGATMDYGDGRVEQISGVKASHKYDKVGTYTITATLKFSIDGAVRNVQCQTQISANACPTNPNLPSDSPDCAPCEYYSTLPKDSPKCVPPATPSVPELPKTGAGDMVLSGFGAGSMIVSASLYLGSRKDFLMTLLNR